jgi:hypothetical protein
MAGKHGHQVISSQAGTYMHTRMCLQPSFTPMPIHPHQSINPNQIRPDQTSQDLTRQDQTTPPPTSKCFHSGRHHGHEGGLAVATQAVLQDAGQLGVPAGSRKKIMKNVKW